MKNLTSVQDIFDLLKRNIWWLIIFVFFGALVSAAVTFCALPEKYSSEVQLVPKQPEVDALNANTINASLTLIDTYKDFVKGEFILKQVKSDIASQYNYNIPLSEIKKSIEVTQETNSQIFSIKVLTDSSRKSAILANSIANVFAKNAEDIVGGSKVTIISEATISKNPVSPNKPLNTIIGGALGFIVGILVIYFSAFFGRSIKNKDFIFNSSPFAIIGTVNTISKKDYRKGVRRTQNYISNFQESENNKFTPRKRRRNK